MFSEVRNQDSRIVRRVDSGGNGCKQMFTGWEEKFVCLNCVSLELVSIRRLIKLEGLAKMHLKCAGFD